MHRRRSWLRIWQASKILGQASLGILLAAQWGCSPRRVAWARSQALGQDLLLLAAALFLIFSTVRLMVRVKQVRENVCQARLQALHYLAQGSRSEERRVGKVCDSTCRSRVLPVHKR